MHDIEPYYSWMDIYRACDDERSPFFEREYNEFHFEHAVYNYLIHPQWDEFGSQTLYLKILFADYNEGFAVIEMIGEWNDALYNDIMILKRDLIESMMDEGIDKFILIGENVLNFHASDDSYYEEWFQEVENGWIAMVNFRDHVVEEFSSTGIDYYLNFGGNLNDLNWRKLSPRQLYDEIETIMSNRLSA